MIFLILYLDCQTEELHPAQKLPSTECVHFSARVSDGQDELGPELQGVAVYLSCDAFLAELADEPERLHCRNFVARLIVD